MKKIVWLVAVVFCLAACENRGNTNLKADSLKEKLDTTIEKIGDSAKTKGERTLEAIKEKVREIGSAEDSVPDDTIQ